MTPYWPTGLADNRDTQYTKQEEKLPHVQSSANLRHARRRLMLAGLKLRSGKAVLLLMTRGPHGQL